eukprot:TRINITY_DN3235_c0_g2_i2.p4 TRINITY_DN3235_c0_g2~~TRINITY_DN3235_c0_g2_i2.p4  ORF type:complete len:255 (-),score=6.78 TRINITY_DN3235_c0_g2_i2:1354-2118(-)
MSKLLYLKSHKLFQLFYIHNQYLLVKFGVEHALFQPTLYEQFLRHLNDQKFEFLFLLILKDVYDLKIFLMQIEKLHVVLIVELNNLQLLMLPNKGFLLQKYLKQVEFLVIAVLDDFFDKVFLVHFLILLQCFVHQNGLKFFPEQHYESKFQQHQQLLLFQYVELCDDGQQEQKQYLLLNIYLKYKNVIFDLLKQDVDSYLVQQTNLSDVVVQYQFVNLEDELFAPQLYTFIFIQHQQIFMAYILKKYCKFCLQH